MRDVFIIKIFLLLLILVGCNNSTSVIDQNDPYESLPVVKIIADSPGAVQLIEAKKGDIAEQLGVKVELYFPNKLTDRLEDFLFNTNDVYDIFILFPNKIPDYVERNMLRPIDNYVRQIDDLTDILPIYQNLYMKYDNQYYAMPYDGDSHLLFYRKDIFEKYNDEYRSVYGKELTPPETWEEYDQISEFLTRDTTGDGIADLHGTAILGSDGMRYIWFAQRFLSMGGEYFDENMNPNIHSEKGILALQQLIDLMENGVTPPDSLYDWEELNHAFLQGHVAMITQFSDTVRFSYDDAWDTKVKNKVGVALVPGVVDGKPRGGVWFGRTLTISKDSKEPDLAWKVIQYLTSSKVSNEGVHLFNSGNDPYRESHFESVGSGPFPSQEIYQEFLDTVYESLQNTNADLIIPGGWDYMKALDKQIGLAYMGIQTAEEALENTEKEWEEITESYGRDSQKMYYEKWKEKLMEVNLID